MDLEVQLSPYSQGEMTVAEEFPGVVDGDGHHEGFGHLLYQHLQALGLEFLGGAVTAAGSFRKNDGRPFVLI